jgi:hypothetical protein
MRGIAVIELTKKSTVIRLMKNIFLPHRIQRSGARFDDKPV